MKKEKLTKQKCSCFLIEQIGLVSEFTKLLRRVFAKFLVLFLSS